MRRRRRMSWYRGSDGKHLSVRYSDIWLDAYCEAEEATPQEALAYLRGREEMKHRLAEMR